MEVVRLLIAALHLSLRMCLPLEMCWWFQAVEVVVRDTVEEVVVVL
jgi:hypothetical protein